MSSRLHPARTDDPHYGDSGSTADEQFGTFLKGLRLRWDVGLDEIEYYLPQYLPGWGDWQRATYCRIENGRRAPLFKELLPLYQTLWMAGVEFSVETCARFLLLARHKMEQKAKRSEHKSHEEWSALEAELATVDQLPRSYSRASSSNQDERLISTPFTMPDTDHILGRDLWLQSMLEYLQQTTSPREKVIVLQGAMGIGKTSGLRLLHRDLLMKNETSIYFTCPPLGTSDMSPDDCLKQFLARIQTELGMTLPETAPIEPLAQQTASILNQLAQVKRPIVLIVDNGETIMDEAGHLAEAWHQFLSAFMVSQHQSTLFLASREWPGWFGRDPWFLHATIMPELSPTLGARLLQQRGFAQEPEALLLQASKRCGGNPLALELLAQIAQHPVLPLSLEFLGNEDAAAETNKGSPSLLRQVLLQDHLFANEIALYELKALLDQVISHRLQPDARQLLNVLAVSVIPLPPLFLRLVCPKPAQTLTQLHHASLLAYPEQLHVERIHLLPLVAEAVIQQLIVEQQLDTVEEQVIRIFTSWLTSQTFREQDEQEKASLVTELAILLLKHSRFLEAAELIIEHGWLSVVTGQTARLARLTYRMTEADDQWRATGEGECGGLLLRAHLARYLSKKGIGKREREEAYKRIYDLWKSQRVSLRPSTMVHVTHHLIRVLIYQNRFSEAQTLLRGIRHSYGEELLVDTRATAVLLGNEGYLAGRWSESKQQVPEECHSLKQASVWAYMQAISLLRQCEIAAPPLLKSTVYFTLARMLNDLAYYQRQLGALEEAKRALEECIVLKERGFTLAASLAVSHGEYAQVLADLGRFRDALAHNALALTEMQSLSTSDTRTIQMDLAMLKAERGRIFFLLKQFEEAEPLLREAEPFLIDARGTLKMVVEQQLHTIEAQYQQNPQRVLDWRWFARYHELLSYDSTAWYGAAGPFTYEEQEEWETVAHRQDEEALAQTAQLLRTSRDRELSAALVEQRTPRLLYPLIPIDEVEQRSADLQRLQHEIAEEEENALVRRFYREAIDTNLADLAQAKATYLQDNASYRLQNARQFTTPRQEEMLIALQQLWNLVSRGMQRTETAEVSRSLVSSLQQWGVLPFLNECETSVPQQAGSDHQSRLKGLSRKTFSPAAIQRFYTDGFEEYGIEGWSVVPDSTMSHARIELDMRKVYIPAERSMACSKMILEFAHELEVHVVRAESGAKSRLLLLSSGTHGYLPTDEGIAIHYEEETIRAQKLSVTPKLWLGTLATGLACGVMTPPLTFFALLSFFEQVFLLQQLLAGKAFANAQAEAHRNAISRCLRTFRGVPRLDEPGVCSAKDWHYLEGYLSVAQAFKAGVTFDQLMVGSCAWKNLPALAELGISTPAITHRKIALDPELVQRLMKLEE